MLEPIVEKKKVGSDQNEKFLKAVDGDEWSNGWVECCFLQNLECDVSVWGLACLLAQLKSLCLSAVGTFFSGGLKKVDSVNWLSFSIILTFFVAMLQTNPSTLHLFQIFKIYENYKME